MIDRRRRWDLRNLDKVKAMKESWEKRNPEKVKEHRRKAARTYYYKHKDDLRNKALELLGNKCAKCGIEDKRVLQFDHIDGGGNRDQMRRRGIIQYYKHIVGTNGFGYQILCANCNWIKKFDNDESGTKEMIVKRWGKHSRALCVGIGARSLKPLDEGSIPSPGTN